MHYIFQVSAAVLILSGLSVFLMMYWRRRIGVQRLRMNHEVGGFVYAVVGTIFAVTVALIVDTVYDEYLLAEKRVTNEAFQLSTLYQLADWYPDSGGPALKLALMQYVKTVVETEWPKSRDMLNHASPEANRAFQAIAFQVRNMHPGSFQQQTAYGEMVQKLSSLNEARYSRIYVRPPSIPAAMWILVLTGGVITIGFTMFFAMESARVQMMVVFSITALICSNIMLMFIVHYPFNGITVTPPYALIELLKKF